MAVGRKRSRKQSRSGGEFCVVHPDGSVTDAELHEPILSAAEDERGVQISRERMIRRGFAPKAVDRLFPRKLTGAPAGAAEGQSPVMQGDRVATVYLVSCVGKKGDHACSAADLYASEWFRKARAYVEATGCPWFILSAEYGLLKPSCFVEPYNKTLNRMTRPERQDWAKRVIAKMDVNLPPADRIVVLAGERYREFLMGYLRSRAAKVEVPMEGMPIGKQLQFLRLGSADARL